MPWLILFIREQLANHLPAFKRRGPRQASPVYGTPLQGEGAEAGLVFCSLQSCQGPTLAMMQVNCLYLVPGKALWFDVPTCKMGIKTLTTW